MKRYPFILVVFLLLTSTLVPAARAQIDARMLQYPDVSETKIVFSYAGDLWVAPKTGGTALKLSSPPGQELLPHFSPDGSHIAYTANYDGALDVYVVPTSGGAPTRVTYNGMTDRVLDWYPDGKRLLFASPMKSGRQRYDQIFQVSATGGLPRQLPVPYGEFASLSPDGSRIAYTPKSRAFRTWKRYRGGWAADIWIFDLAKKTAENITQNPANDEFPMWVENRIYFLSDRGPNERANIWCYDLDTKQVQQLTHFADFDVHFPSLGPKDIVFEAGGELYLLNLADDSTSRVEIKVLTDASTLLPRSESATSLIESASIAPNGKRALFEARGDVFNVPAEHGPVVDLTQTSGTAERYPAWSPDGKSVAYWSDASGEYELTIRDLGDPSHAKRLTSYGPGFRYRLFWSPDSQKLAFVDQTMTMHVYDRQKDRTLDVDKGLYLFEGGLENFAPSWSPDSRWLAYRRDLNNRTGAIFLYDVQAGKTHQVTSGYYNDGDPTFDPEGLYLYFTTNRTFDPIYSAVDNTFVYTNMTQLAFATLSDTTRSPLAPRDDTVTGVAATKDDKGAKDKDKDKKDKDKNDAAPKPTVITLDGFEGRVQVLPPKAGRFGSLAAVPGKLVYQRLPNQGSTDDKSPLMSYDLKEREEKTIAADVDGFEVSADHEHALVVKKRAYSIIELKPDQKLDKTLPVDQLRMTVDPRAEWRQIFNDVWRIERDFFYDPAMHGVNWDSMRVRYGALVDQCMTRWDLNYVIGELIGEMSSSHTYRGGGDVPHEERLGIGYLGVDWQIDQARYRIKTIVHGAPWDVEVRSPLDEPGVNVKEGDYVLAVNGTPMDTTRAPWAAFAGLAGKTVALTVNDKPSFDGARDVIVKTLDDETRLRYLAWVESSRKHVDEVTDGKVGYIYVPNTGIEGQTELVRQFAAQYTRQGLIIDERFNSGGQIPDRFIELLNRKPLAYWAVRDGHTWQWPPVANFGPKVMLINGWSGSGGDALPDFFRKAGVGLLIGTRTWGGLIGISGSPTLIDGGRVTVPTFRMYNPDGTWFREGHGVDPDIEVIEDPGQLARGIDPQLERGIQEVVKSLAAHPVVMPPRPAPQKR